MARPRQITDEQILRVAREVFTELGPTVSTEVIAEQLGVSSTALFKRFGRKDDLLLAALLPDGPPAWFELAAAGPGEGPIRQQLLTLGREISGFLERLIPAIWTLKAAGHDPHVLFGEGDRVSPTGGVMVLARWFELGAARGLLRVDDPVSAAVVFLGALHTRVFFQHMARTHGGVSHLPPHLDLDQDRYLQHLVDILWRGLDPEDRR